MRVKLIVTQCSVGNMMGSECWGFYWPIRRQNSAGLTNQRWGQRTHHTGVGRCDQSGDRNWKLWPSTNNEGAEGATATGWSGSWYYEALGNKKYIMVILLEVVDGGSHIILNSWWYLNNLTGFVRLIVFNQK